MDIGLVITTRELPPNDDRPYEVHLTVGIKRFPLGLYGQTYDQALEQFVERLGGVLRLAGTVKSEQPF